MHLDTPKALKRRSYSAAGASASVTGRMEEAKGRLERAIQLARFGNRVKLGGKPEAWQPSQGHSWVGAGR